MYIFVRRSVRLKGNTHSRILVNQETLRPKRGTQRRERLPLLGNPNSGPRGGNVSITTMHPSGTLIDSDLGRNSQTGLALKDNLQKKGLHGHPRRRTTGSNFLEVTLRQHRWNTSLITTSLLADRRETPDEKHADPRGRYQ